MKHVLGWATFEILDGFRDDSTYMYQSPDERDLAQVTPMPDAADANDILKSSTAALEGFYGSALIYTRPKQFGLDGGAEAPAIEGEIHDPATGARTRFALIALHHGRCKANLLVIGGQTPFLASVARIVKSVRFVSDVVGVARPGTAAQPLATTPAAAPGAVRRLANCVTLELPATWSSPSSLLFSDERLDDATLRITTAEPPVGPGVISFAKELPAARSDTVKVLTETITPGRPNDRSWSGRWTVEHRSPLRTTVVVLLEACISLVPSNAPLTVHGDRRAAKTQRVSRRSRRKQLHGCPAAHGADPVRTVCMTSSQQASRRTACDSGALRLRTGSHGFAAGGAGGRPDLGPRRLGLEGGNGMDSVYPCATACELGHGPLGLLREVTRPSRDHVQLRPRASRVRLRLRLAELECGERRRVRRVHRKGLVGLLGQGEGRHRHHPQYGRPRRPRGAGERRIARCADSRSHSRGTAVERRGADVPAVLHGREPIARRLGS
jgi:hypothetical protein